MYIIYISVENQIVATPTVADKPVVLELEPALDPYRDPYRGMTPQLPETVSPSKSC